MLDGNGVKAMPGSIPAPNCGSIRKFRKIIGRQMGQTEQKGIEIKKRQTIFNIKHLSVKTDDLKV
jgi:hypothetical protein